MPRRGNVPKREILPDPMYNSVLVTKLINAIMLDGKKGVAQKVVYDAFDIIKEKTGKEPLEAFTEAMNNIMPSLEVKARRVGGATYQVPIEVRPARRQTLGLRWLVGYARKRGENVGAGAFDIVKEKTEKDPLEVFSQAMENIMPSLEVKSRRVGGATYQVPMEVRPERRQTLGLRWLTNYSRARSEKTMKERLAGEIMDACNNLGASVKKREDTHKMADSNKAFAHFRW